MANAAAGGGETRMCSHMQWQPTRWVNTRPVSTWLAILCFVSHMGNHFAAAWCGRTCGVVHAKSAHHASMAFQGIASAIQAVRYAKPAMATLLLLAWNLGGLSRQIKVQDCSPCCSPALTPLPHGLMCAGWPGGVDAGQACICLPEGSLGHHLLLRAGLQPGNPQRGLQHRLLDAALSGY